MGKTKLPTDKNNQKVLDDYKSFVIEYLHACLYDRKSTFGIVPIRGQDLFHMEGR